MQADIDHPWGVKMCLRKQHSMCRSLKGPQRDSSLPWPGTLDSRASNSIVNQVGRPIQRKPEKKSEEMLVTPRHLVYHD